MVSRVVIIYVSPLPHPPTENPHMTHKTVVRGTAAYTSPYPLHTHWLYISAAGKKFWGRCSIEESLFENILFEESLFGHFSGSNPYDIVISMSESSLALAPQWETLGTFIINGNLKKSLKFNMNTELDLAPSAIGTWQGRDAC